MESTSGLNSSGTNIRAMASSKVITQPCKPSSLNHSSQFYGYYAWFVLAVLLCPIYPADALDFKGKMTLNAFNMSGKNRNTTTFDGGKSSLKWPIDVKTAGASLTVSGDDVMEVEIGLIAEPWRDNTAPMKDYDYIDESNYPDRSPHEGVDIYSESTLDSKALILSIRSRVFPFRTRYLSAGVSAGYEYQEFDYRAYDTRQVGFGPWSDQSIVVSGPVSFYTVDYDIFSLGLVVRSAIEDVVTITLDASILPVVMTDDEDEHLRRSRVSNSSCDGYGYMSSLSTDFRVSEKWSISTLCGLSRIHTDGHTTQYWYGDDPATLHFNDTGQKLAGIDTEIDQDTFRVAIGATYRF
jgi:Omptin family